MIFPEARHDDQVDSMVQYLQWVRKTSDSPFGVRDLGHNPNKGPIWLRNI